MNDLLPSAVLVLAGAALAVSGIMVHRKRWLGWVRIDRLVPGTPSLAITWLGLWLATLPLLPLALDNAPELLGGVLALVSNLLLIAGILGFLWYPGRLMPRWMQEDRKRILAGDDLFARTYLQERHPAPRPGDPLPEPRRGHEAP